MKVLILGCGLVGMPLASMLREAGHQVTGTTTTPGKVKQLQQICDDVRVLVASDTDGVREAIDAADAVVVGVGPNAARSVTPEGRATHYRETLTDVADLVVDAAGDKPIIAFSSLVVYGNDNDHLDEIVEDAPRTDWDDPSPINFKAAEDAYARADNACMFRCPEIHGADDPPLATKVKMAHDHLGGSVPFRPDTLFYQLPAEDAARAAAFALEHRLTGIFNLVPSILPRTNSEVFDELAAEQGLPALEYRSEIPGPATRISNARLLGTGFEI